MPSASNEQQALMELWFGSIDDAGPYNCLISRGYIEKAGMSQSPLTIPLQSR